MTKPLVLFTVSFLSLPLFSGETSRSLDDRSQRGKLNDRFEKVRGDSGKWRDAPLLQVTPSPASKPPGTSLDDWADGQLEKKSKPVPGEETWLIYRTEQLDDNDRLWIERIERKGNRIEVTLEHAVWQGYYSKNFTWYAVFGVNLGKLPAGDYEVTWTVHPLVFKAFEDPKNRRASWPRDEQPATGKKPKESRARFSLETAP